MRIVAGQGVSEVAATLLTMSAVVDLAAWRLQRLAKGGPTRPPGDAASEARPGDDPAVDRLDRAVERLHELVSGALDGQGRLVPRIETELLAIMGELTVGRLGEAADRAERLADQLAQ